MALKRCAAITALVSAILLIFACFTVNADAATTPKKAKYIVHGSYNETTKEYTAEVYLDTEVYLAAGTIGLKFDPVALTGLTWNDASAAGATGNDGFMQVDTTNFSYLKTPLMDSHANYFKTNGYIVVQWGNKDADASNPKLSTDPAVGRIHLGTIKATNVNSAANPFSLLDWSTTTPAGTTQFTDKDSVSMSLNEEIWRSCTAAELSDDPDTPGYYQGCAYDDTDEWIDIGMEFESESDSRLTVKGTVYAYNPKYDIEVYAYDAAGAFENTGVVMERVIYLDGRVKYTYEIKIAAAGTYNFVIAKPIHLTYLLTNEAINYDHTMDDVTLICGDIDSDGYVKTPDRSCLVRFLNRQRQWNSAAPQFDAADLNGDGLVNLFDLNILNADYDKKYI